MFKGNAVGGANVNNNVKRVQAVRSSEIKPGEKPNFWKSTMSGVVYEMPASWMPRFGGWELVRIKNDVDREEKQIKKQL